MEHGGGKKRKAAYAWPPEVDLRLCQALRNQLGSDTWSSSSPAFDWQAIFRDGGPWPEGLSAEALKTRWQNSFRGWPLTSKERHQGRRADRIELPFIERLIRERASVPSGAPSSISKSSLKRKKAEPSEEEAAYEDDRDDAELAEEPEPQQVPYEFRLTLEDRQDLETWQDALRQATRSGRSSDAFVLRLDDGSFELDPSAPLLPEQPAAVEALVAEFSSPAVSVLSEADGRWMCCRDAGPLLECWDPAPDLPRPRCELLCGNGRRLELRPCPALGGGSGALVALAAAGLLSRLPANEPLDLISRWPGEAAARDWLSLQLLLRCRPALCMLRREERPRYVHPGPCAALREAVPELRPWLERLSFEDLRDAVADHHHLRVELLREGAAQAEFDWDPQADDQRSFSLLGESAAAPRSYVLVMSARPPPPGAPPRLAIRWGATCGARFGGIREPPTEVALEAGQMAFSLGRARIAVRWQARAAAGAVVPALPPPAPPAAPSLSFGFAADEEAKLLPARDGSLAVGAYRTTVRKVHDQLLNAEGELDEEMANSLFCCLQARPAHAVLDQDILALARELGSKAVVGRLHHAAASSPAVFHLPIHADGRCWAYAAASSNGCLCIFSMPDSAEQIARTLIGCFAEAFPAARWRSLTKLFDPRCDSALQALLAHVLTMRCDDSASLEGVDHSTVDARSARRWLASRLVASAQLVADEADARQAAPLSASAPPPDRDRSPREDLPAGPDERASSADEAGHVLKQAISIVPPSSVPPQHPLARCRRSFALSPEDEEPLRDYLASNGDTLHIGGCVVSHSDVVQCLLPADGWLNDELVNSLAALEEPRPGHVVLESHSFTKALRQGSDAVRRLLDKSGAAMADSTHIPIHGDAHWMYAEVHRPAKKIDFYDSMHPECPLPADDVRHSDPAKAHVCPVTVRSTLMACFEDGGGWTFRVCACPRQWGTNCGVHAVLTHLLSWNRSASAADIVFDFSAADAAGPARRWLAARLVARTRREPPPPPPPDPYKDGTLEELKKACGIDIVTEPGADGPRSDFVLAAVKDGRTARILTARLRPPSWSIEVSDLVASVSDGSGQLSVGSLALPCGAEAEISVATHLPDHQEFHLSLPPPPPPPPLHVPPAPSPKLKPPPKKKRTAASTGVVNSDSNCYLGVVLMALFADRELRQQAFELRALPPPPPDAPPEVRDSAFVLPAVADVFRTLQAGEGPASPQALLSRVQARKEFAGKKFQDAPDVYHWLVERLGPLGERFSFSAVQLNGDCPECKLSAPGSVGYSRWCHVVTALPVERSARTTVELSDLFPESAASVDAECSACGTALPQRWQFETAPWTLAMEIARLVPQGPVPPEETWRVKVPETLSVTYGARSRRYRLAAAIYYTARHGVEHYVAVARGDDDDTWWRYDDAQPAKSYKSFEKAINGSQTRTVLLRMLLWCAVHEREERDRIGNDSFVLEAVEV